MMQRVTGEITRMETLVDGLRMRPAAHGRLPDTGEPPAQGDHAT
jgi:hypothetical protein